MTVQSRGMSTFFTIYRTLLVVLSLLITITTSVTACSNGSATTGGPKGALSLHSYCMREDNPTPCVCLCFVFTCFMSYTYKLFPSMHPTPYHTQHVQLILELKEGTFRDNG